MIDLQLAITNTYEDGEEIVTHARTSVPPPPDRESDAYEDWKYDHVYCETGTGRTDGHAWYDVEVLESSDPDEIPVGTMYEFGY